MGCKASRAEDDIYRVPEPAPAAIPRRQGSPPTRDDLKRQAAYKAVDDYVSSGNVIGLGSGTTAFFCVERVGELLASGALKDVILIPTSVRAREQAERLGIQVATLDTHCDLDVAIDGCDKVDANLNLVKGGKGALLREKMVILYAKKFIVVVDDSKMAFDGLGPGKPVPVEIVQFCHERTMREIAKLPALAGCQPKLRLGDVTNPEPDGDEPAVTDNGNYIVDLWFGAGESIRDLVAAGDQLKNTVGVVEHGLFTGMTTACIIAGPDGVTVQSP